MSTTPAATLARLKVLYPKWVIRKARPFGFEAFTAVNRESGERIHERTLGGLEYELQARVRSGHPPA